MNQYNGNEHFNALYDRCEREYAFKAGTREACITWQERFRIKLKEALGLIVMKNDLAGFEPEAEKLQEEDAGDYLRESWILWTEPTVPLPFWLLKPKNTGTEALPLVLTPHGHNHPGIYVGITRNEDEQKKIVEGERDIAIQAVREGYLVIAPTARAFGDTRMPEDLRNDVLSSCRIELMHDLLVGRTPIGTRVWDISRLIDWASTREDVDADRIAVTGNSGGGTVTLFSAACDTRIRVAVPSSYFCTFRGSIGSIHHCDCNYVPGMLRMGEMHDVAGLIAPRPFMAVAGVEDPIFPFDQVTEAFDQLRKIYAVAGAHEKCRLSVGQGGHRYYKKEVWPFVRESFAE